MLGRLDGEGDEAEVSKSLPPPFLPGYPHPYITPRLLGRDNYRRSQHFDYVQSVPQWVGSRKPGIGGDHIPGQLPRSRHSRLPMTNRTGPRWAAFDKQVLCFDAYFKEAVFLSHEQYRIRKCKIKFFLADDSIVVVEPETRNSGMPQGKFLKRHRIQKPPPHNDEYYMAEDFNIGIDITLYDRTFHITGCDAFTRQFFDKMERKLNSPEATPYDPYQEWRDNEMDSPRSRRPYESTDSLKQFLDHDGQVLRFYCYWDDRESLYGDKRNMIMHYYLADDTIEIREVLPPNSGRELIGRVFLHRSKVSKPRGSFLPQISNNNNLLLNVLGSGKQQRLMLDRSDPGPHFTDKYTAKDLKIGETINVWGRKFTIYDCDKFTKEYLQTQLGTTDIQPIKAGTPKTPSASSSFPPYNGYGSEDDSLANCYPSKLEPRRPVKSYVKFVDKEKDVLRFNAKLISTEPTNLDRKFIVSFYLSDDTLSVFEPPSRNSGFITGRFLERTRVKKPNQPMFNTKKEEYYEPQDMFVGSHVKFNFHEFYLSDADEFTLNYMEKHSDEFPFSNINKIKTKLKQVASTNVEEVKKFFTKYDYKQSGKVPFELFRSLLIKVSGDELTEHEILTVARHHRIQEKVEVSLEAIQSEAHDLLRKNNFDGFRKLETLCYHRDVDRKGWLYPEQVRSVCHSLKMPLTDDTLNELWARLQKDQFGRINYYDFNKLVNWREFPVPGPTKLEQQQKKRQFTYVDYKALMHELYGQ